jgi:ubiquitin carboxyl-terminal hydrolase 8
MEQHIIESDTDSDTSHTLCGLANIGNTCYMNSVLQVLAHIKQLNKYFITKIFKQPLVHNISQVLEKEPRDESYGDKVTRIATHTLTIQFYKLLIEMTHNQSIAPISFKRLLSCKNETFAGHSQNDSHEFLAYLLDVIHEETKCSLILHPESFPPSYHMMNTTLTRFAHDVNKTTDINEKIRILREYSIFIQSHQKDVIEHMGITHWANYVKYNYSVISEHFTGMYHSSVTCSECGGHGHTFDIFTSLSLEIPIKSITQNVVSTDRQSDALRITRDDVSPITEKQNISIYDCLDNFTRVETLDGDEKYSCVTCNKKCVASKKIIFWNIPDIVVINFKRFSMSPLGIRKINNYIDYDTTIDFSRYMQEYRSCYRYELIAVVHHYGSFGGGHYVSFNKINDVWYHFNDSNISKVDSSVIKQQIITDSSYILVFSAIK